MGKTCCNYPEFFFGESDVGMYRISSSGLSDILPFLISGSGSGSGRKAANCRIFYLFITKSCSHNLGKVAVCKQLATL